MGTYGPDTTLLFILACSFCAAVVWLPTFVMAW
jgi:hypothetical protein